MKRSGSKLIAKAGAVKNISKAGYRFDVKLGLESVDQMLGTSDVVCTWERGPKVHATPPFKINKHRRIVDFDGAALQQEVTMFKKKKTDPGFEPKVFRLAIRQGSGTGRVVAKIDLNFADYVGVPSVSKRISAPLSSGGRLVLRVESRYLGEAKKRSRMEKEKSSEGEASSMYSVSTLTDESASIAAAVELAERDADEQDLDDLALADPGSSSSGASRAPSADEPVPRAPTQGGRDGGAPKESKPRQGGGAMSGRAEVQRVHAENMALRRENDQLRKQASESASLRRDVEELKARLSREPVYADVVRDLRESKMALAILTMERDELHQAVRSNKL